MDATTNDTRCLGISTCGYCDDSCPANKAETTTWCNDCGAPMGGESECKAYEVLYRKRDRFREILKAAGLTLKAKGPNILVLDKDGHEEHL